MSDTIRQKALHQIHLARKTKKGERETVEPGEEFDCPKDDLEFLRKSGACVDPDRNVVQATTESSAIATDSEEERRQVLLGQAKDLKIKGIRKDMTAEKLQEKIDQWRAENGDGPVGDGDDGDDGDGPVGDGPVGDDGDDVL